MIYIVDILYFLARRRIYTHLARNYICKIYVVKNFKFLRCEVKSAVTWVFLRPGFFSSEGDYFNMQPETLRQNQEVRLTEYSQIPGLSGFTNIMFILENIKQIILLRKMDYQKSLTFITDDCQISTILLDDII